MLLVLPPDVALHARPAGAFVKAAMGFKARITVSHGEKQADAKSILSVLGLGARGGVALTIRAEGDDAEAAVGALADCVTGLHD